MTAINRVRTEWTGFIGAPGVSTMYCLEVSAFRTALETFWNAIRTQLPPAVHLQIQPSGDIIEAVTGALTGTWTAGAAGPIVGTASAPYSAPVGAVVEWITGSVIDGHRLKGKNFLVPLSSEVFEVDGRIASARQGVFTAAAAQLVLDATGNMVVWHRPFAGSVATPTHPARPAHPGTHAGVTSSRVPSIAAVLRSRRD